MSIAAAIARARQSFGLDAYSDALDPAGMVDVRSLALEKWMAGATAVGFRVRAWAGNERRTDAPWAIELLTDGDIVVTITYRIGTEGDPVERELPIDELWRLARNPMAQIFDAVIADPGIWSWAVTDVEADDVRYFVQIEDRRGIGRVVWDHQYGGQMVRMVRAVTRRRNEARERAKDARKKLGIEADSVELAALADYLHKAGGGKQSDDGPPAVSCVIIATAPGRVSRILDLSGTVDRTKSRRSRLATRSVDALMVAAFGATPDVIILPPVSGKNGRRPLPTKLLATRPWTIRRHSIQTTCPIRGRRVGFSSRRHRESRTTLRSDRTRIPRFGSRTQRATTPCARWTARSSVA